MSEILSRAEALDLIENTPLSDIMARAAAVREDSFGNRAALCGIVNARSGRCSEDCRFCAQSAHHQTGVETYALLDENALVTAAQEAKEQGVHCFGIVTSGATVNDGELENICQAVSRITGQLGMRCSASLGKLTAEQFRKLRDAGLPVYHHNLETSERFFPQICTTHTWAERVETVRTACAAGLGICCGGLFGLGEEWEDRIDMALSLRDLEVESVPLNFLHAIPGTPLAKIPPMTPDDILRTIAIYRLILPESHIRVCGGRSVNLGTDQDRIFAAGADGMMIGNYLTTAGRSLEDDFQMLRREGMKCNYNY